MTKTLPFAPPDPERRWSTERRDYLSAHYPANTRTRDIVVALNEMIGLPVNVKQIAAYAGRVLHIKRAPAMVKASQEAAIERMKPGAKVWAETRKDRTAKRALERQVKRAAKAQAKADRLARKEAKKRRDAATDALLTIAENQRRIAEKRNRLTELFMADQQRLDILRMQQERKAAELAASKPRSKPRPERPRRDPSEQPKTFTMTAMQMPDPRLAAYREQCGAASRGRVADSYVAPLTRTLPE